MAQSYEEREKEFRENEIKFLKDGNFPHAFCCMKKRNPKGGMPEFFGAVISGEPTKVYLRDDEGEMTVKFEEFETVEAMLDAGWEID